MIRKLLSSIVVFVVFIFGSISPVSAHTFASDGSVGAIIHIDPEDDPIVGIPSNIYFDIKDKRTKFSPENCACIVEIYQAGKLIHSESLHKHTSLTFTFPESNIYEVVLKGNPDFRLAYTLRVSRKQEATSTPQTSSITPFLVSLGIIACLLYFVIKYKKNTAKLVCLIFLIGLFLHILIVAHPHTSSQNSTHVCCLISQVTLVSNIVLLSPPVSPPIYAKNISPTTIFVFLLEQPARSPPFA